jgi:hypothetical protein
MLQFNFIFLQFNFFYLQTFCLICRPYFFSFSPSLFYLKPLFSSVYDWLYLSSFFFSFSASDSLFFPQKWSKASTQALAPPRRNASFAFFLPIGLFHTSVSGGPFSVISKLVLSTSIGVDVFGLESVFAFCFLLPSCFSAANSFCLSCYFG